MQRSSREATLVQLPLRRDAAYVVVPMQEHASYGMCTTEIDGWTSC